jgi:hypothetical protein
MIEVPPPPVLPLLLLLTVEQDADATPSAPSVGHCDGNAAAQTASVHDEQLLTEVLPTAIPEKQPW